MPEPLDLEKLVVKVKLAQSLERLLEGLEVAVETLLQATLMPLTEVVDLLVVFLLRLSRIQEVVDLAM